MHRLSRLCGIFARSQIGALPEDSPPGLQSSVDQIFPALSLSFSPAETSEEMDKDQAPQVPPRIRTPQCPESLQQSSQLDSQLSLPVRRVSQTPSEISKNFIHGLILLQKKKEKTLVKKCVKKTT